MLAKAGNTDAELQCGTHAPLASTRSRGEVPPPPPWSPLAHNCSGKHSGMLAYCSQCGWSKDELPRLRPPAAAARSAMPSRTTPASTRPALRLGHRRLLGAQLRAAAGRPRAWPSRGSPATTTIREYGSAPRTLVDAMTAHPEMVSGDGPQRPGASMRAGRGDWVAKIGAEGVQAIGVRSRGLGIAIKVADGAKRGLHPATVDGARPARTARRRAARGAGAVAASPRLRNYRGTGDRRRAAVGCPGQRSTDVRSSEPSAVSPTAGPGDRVNFARACTVCCRQACTRSVARCRTGQPVDRAVGASPDAAPAVRRA